MTWELFKRDEVRRELVERTRPMAYSTQSIRWRQHGHRREEFEEPWSEAMSCHPWPIPMTARDDADDDVWFQDIVPLPLDESEYLPWYHPEEDDDPGDQPWAPARQALKTYTGEFEPGDNAWFEMLVERAQRMQAHPSQVDPYASTWDEMQAREERAARLEQERRDRERWILQERRARQMDAYSREHAKRHPPQEEDWDFLPDHPFERRSMA